MPGKLLLTFHISGQHPPLKSQPCLTWADWSPVFLYTNTFVHISITAFELFAVALHLDDPLPFSLWAPWKTDICFLLDVTSTYYGPWSLVLRTCSKKNCSIKMWIFFLPALSKLFGYGRANSEIILEILLLLYWSIPKLQWPIELGHSRTEVEPTFPTACLVKLFGLGFPYALLGRITRLNSIIVSEDIWLTWIRINQLKWDRLR